MRILVLLALSLALAACGSSNDTLTIGFSQVGSESAWRKQFSESVKAEAAERGIDLKFDNAYQKQENQFQAVRRFIELEVDGIVLAPVVEMGWEDVLKEARKAGIPVVIVDRNVSVADDSLYVTRVASDFVDEGRKAARWLMEATGGECDMVELHGTEGATAAIDRSRGFGEVVANHSRARILRTATADFSRSRGKEVMKDFMRDQNLANICAVWAHNDEMGLGAAEAIEEAGLTPGEDVLIVSVDGTTEALKAVMEGRLNATVELSPDMGDPAFDVIEQYQAGKRDFPKRITVSGELYTSENAAQEYRKRTQ